MLGIWYLSKRLKEREIVKTPKDTHFECDNRFLVSMLTKIICEMHPESLIDREAADFCYGPSCINHINSQRIFLEQDTELKCPLYQLFSDFEKVFKIVNKECIWNALRRRDIPKKIIAIITATDDSTKYQVLFLLVLVALSGGRGELQSITKTSLNHLEYINDINLLFHWIMNLGQMVLNLEKKKRSLFLI